MTATLELLHSLSATLDQVVLAVDVDLPRADDIHPAIHKVGNYMVDMVRLPAALAALEAQMGPAKARIISCETGVRKTSATVTLLETRLQKLGADLDRNRRADGSVGPPTAIAASTMLGASLPSSRQGYVEVSLVALSNLGGDLARAKVAAKKAEALRKGAITREANLARDIRAMALTIAAHTDRLEETVKVLRKTITHLRNRQEKRLAKLERKSEKREDAAIRSL